MKLRRRHKYVGIALCAVLAGFAVRGMEASNRLHRDTASASVETVMTHNASSVVPIAAPVRTVPVTPIKSSRPGSTQGSHRAERLG